MKRLSDVKISTLDLVPVRHDKGTAESLRNSLNLAQHVEKLGYNRFWVAEHHNMDGIASSATSVLLGYLAGGTSTIRRWRHHAAQPRAAGDCRAVRHPGEPVPGPH
jgi:hypothetical protein